MEIIDARLKVSLPRVKAGIIWTIRSQQYSSRQIEKGNVDFINQNHSWVWIDPIKTLVEET